MRSAARLCMIGARGGTGNVAGGKADPTSTTSVPAPPHAPSVLRCGQTALWATCRPLRCPVSQGGESSRTRDALPTSRAGLRVALCREEGGCQSLALVFIPGHFLVRTAHLPFARGSDGGCVNRAVILGRVGQGWEPGDASRSRSTGNRIYRPVRSLLACV